MRLTWRRSERAEERFETWVAQLHQRTVQEAGQAVSGPCPDEPFLRDLARRSNRIALSDARVDHAASCPECMNRLLTIRREFRSRRQKLVFALATASCLVIAIAAISIALNQSQSRSAESISAVISQTVNLSDAGTLRGQQPQPLRSVSLPAALVRVTVVLPRFSEPGLYLVAVTRDQTGGEVLAHGSGTSTKKDDHEEVSVDLDLRKTTAGSYFLSTTHEQDQASYYYPLKIR